MKKQSKTEYLKRCKTPVIAFFLILFIAVIFTIFLCTSKKQDRTQQELFTKEQEQLTDMTAYLDEIAEIVDTNREHLAEATLSQSDTTQTLTTLSEALTVLEKDLTRIESQIEKQKESQTTENSKVTAAFSRLSESQTKIQEQIAATNTAITAILSDLREKNESQFSKTYEKLETLQADFSKIQEDTKSYYDSLTELVTLLQEESDTRHKELTDTLLAVQKEISTLMENSVASLQLQLDEDFSALMGRLNALHEQIAAAETSINNLLLLMEENNGERQEEIRAAFANIDTAMEQIRADYSNAHIQIQQLIQKLQETEDNNHKETLSALNVMESNMTESSLENLNRITNSLQTMEDSFSSSMNSMQNELSQSFSTLNTDITGSLLQYSSNMTEQLNQLNTNMTNQYQSLTATVNNYDNSQQEALDNLINVLNQRLQEVFQYVSNGKKKLASALLTKGVSIREDATFNEIYNAILSIPQQLVIGVQEIPGTISYDYHYHVNGGGSMPHSEKELSSGGCYTLPAYHTHTGNSRNGGGCYTAPVYHSHTGSCYSEGSHNSSCPSHTEYHPYDCGSVHDWDGDGHGCDGFVAYDCGGHRYLSCNLGSGIVGYSLNCGKNPSTIEYYTPACGLSDGQIIGAHIVYDRNALSLPNAAALSLYDTEETKQHEADITEGAADTTEPEESEAIQTEKNTEISETETVETEEHTETEANAETPPEETDTAGQENISVSENTALSAWE